MSEIIDFIYRFADAISPDWKLWLALVGLFFIGLFFSVREILAWYLKVHQLRTEVIRLRKSIQSLEEKMDGQFKALKLVSSKPNTEADLSQATPAPTPSESIRTPKFEIQH